MHSSVLWIASIDLLFRTADIILFCITFTTVPRS